MPTISVAGTRVTALNRSALLSAVQTRLHNHIPTRIVTPYSEFLFRAMHDSAFRDTLNSADFALPDGVGILWASTFLSTPLTARTAFGTWGKCQLHPVPIAPKPGTLPAKWFCIPQYN